MQTVLLAVHLVIAVFLIGLVMLQKSEGGALGIGGGGGNLFSARGVGNTLTRATAVLAAGFFATSILLTVLANHKGGSSITNIPVQSTPDAGSSASGTAQVPAAPAQSNGDSALLPKLDQKPAVPTTP
jgi:preprotein translocase subunit SecG